MKIFAFVFVVVIFFQSCDNAKNGGNNGNTTLASTQNIPFESISGDVAKGYIKNYIDLIKKCNTDTFSYKPDSVVVKRISFSAATLQSINGNKFEKMQLFVGLDSFNVVRIIIQFKRKKNDYVYYDMSKPKQAFAKDDSFCPPPHPCNDPIEDIER